MALNLNHQTASEFIARFREAYRRGNKERLAKLAKWLLAKIAAGDITDTQARNAFELTAPQWTTKKTQMSGLVAQYDGVMAANGD